MLLVSFCNALTSRGPYHQFLKVEQKINIKLIFVYLKKSTLSEVLNVGVVEVHEGVLDGSEQYRTVLK